MLARIARPVFVTACACNMAFSIIGVFGQEDLRAGSTLLAIIGGGLSFVIATGLAFFVLLKDRDGLDRPWIKAALMFLALGPLAFRGLQMPASVEASCLDNCHGPDSALIQARAIGNIFQSQIAMVGVALAAAFCAARAMTVTLDNSRSKPRSSPV